MDDYFNYFFDEKLAIKCPEREEAHLTIAAKLLEKRKEKQEIDKALNVQKEEFQMKMESLEQRWAELEHKEGELKESLIKFDRFLKDNDAKKARAFKKVVIEKDLQNKKQTEINNFLDEIKMLTKLKEKIDKKLDRYSVNCKYLESVVSLSDDFTEIKELIDRYDTLCAAYKELSERDNQAENCLENLKSKLCDYKTSKQDETFEFTNDIAFLQNYYEHSQQKHRNEEQKWYSVEDELVKNTLQIGMIKMSTYSLYKIVRHYQPHGEESSNMDTKSHLKSIGTFIQDLSQVTTKILHEPRDTDDGE